MGTRALWTTSTVTALLSVLASSGLAAQGPGPADAVPGAEAQDDRRHSPKGPLVLGATTGRLHFLSGLPAAYLDGLTGGPVEADHALDDEMVLGLRLGVRPGGRWLLEAEVGTVDTRFGAANLRTEVDYRGLNVYYTLFGNVYATAGAGAVSYEFTTVQTSDVPPRNTDVSANAGMGLWTQPHFFGDRFTWRTELRDYVSRLTVPSVEPGVQHHLGVLSGLSFSFP